jgi:hypothetical protein
MCGLVGAGLLISQARAQVNYGSVVGNVSDPNGGAVPTAAITITNVGTGQARNTTTNDTGLFSFTDLPSGTYDLDCYKPGFAKFSSRGVPVRINTVSRVDMALAVGNVSEAIQVSAQAASLQADRADVHQEITSTTLANLPVPSGRNYQQLFVTIPGITPPVNAGSEIANTTRALVFNVNGTSEYSNDTRIDGTATNGIWLPLYTAYVPALEAIETVNVATNSFDAEQGLAGGSVINVQIKSGTNALHGAVFEYHNNQHLLANSFFAVQGYKKQTLIYNQFGGVLGGPIKRDKLFYFASFEGTYDHRNGGAAIPNSCGTTCGFATVPTAAMRVGNMSASSIPIYDPATGGANGSGRMPFAGNMIPGSRIDPIVQKLVDLTPLPNLPGLSNNYYRIWPYGFNRQSGDGKINWNPTSKLTIYGRVSTLNYNWFSGNALEATGGSGTKASGLSYNNAVAGTYTISPTFVVDANFGFNKFNTVDLQNDISQDIGLNVLGIPGTNGPDKYEGGWPGFTVTSFTGLGYSSGTQPVSWHDHSVNTVVNATKIRGAHNIRFGLDLARSDMNELSHEEIGAVGSATGSFDFAGGITSILGGPSPNQYNSYAAFLLGLPDQITKLLQVPAWVTTRGWQISLYVRDQWQISRKLTFSFGTRWEHYPMPTRADRGVETFDFRTGKMLVCGVGAVPEDCGIPQSNKLFAPRGGIAYRASETLVIRAGYGISIDPFSLARPFKTNYPTLIGLNITGPNSFQPAGLLKDGIPPLVPPDLGNGIINVPTNVTTFGLANPFRRGYIQSWNFTVQKQFKGGWTGQVGYVGTGATRILGSVNVNAGLPGAGVASEPLLPIFGRSVTTAMYGPVGNGKYNALQSTLERRFAQGFQVQATYTWSKALGIFGTENTGGAPAIAAPSYYNLNRALTSYDRTHNLEVSSVTELPFGKGKRWLNQGGAGSVLAGGWRINSIFSSYSGLPFSVSADGTSCNCPGNTQRADQVKPDIKILGGVNSYFDPLAFASVRDARFGTAGFDSLRGPGVVNLNLGIFRDFRLSERSQLQFRAEAFNASNTPHFANPSANVSNLQLNPDGTVKNLGGFTQITGVFSGSREGIDQRGFRFALRVSF